MLLTSPSEVAMSVTTVVPKPSLLTVNRKVPSANSGKLNFPVSSVVTVRSCPVVGFESLTVAPGTTAPWASRTVPVIRPGNSWATELPTAKVISTTTNEAKREYLVLRLAMAALRKRMRAAKTYPLPICYVKRILLIYQIANIASPHSQFVNQALPYQMDRTARYCPKYRRQNAYTSAPAVSQAACSSCIPTVYYKKMILTFPNPRQYFSAH